MTPPCVSAICTPYIQYCSLPWSGFRPLLWLVASLQGTSHGAGGARAEQGGPQTRRPRGGHTPATATIGTTTRFLPPVAVGRSACVCMYVRTVQYKSMWVGSCCVRRCAPSAVSHPHFRTGGAGRGGWVQAGLRLVPFGIRLSPPPQPAGRGPSRDGGGRSPLPLGPRFGAPCGKNRRKTDWGEGGKGDSVGLVSPQRTSSGRAHQSASPCGGRGGVRCAARSGCGVYKARVGHLPLDAQRARPTVPYGAQRGYRPSTPPSTRWSWRVSLRRSGAPRSGGWRCAAGG